MDYSDINYCIQILNERPKWFFQKDNIVEKLQCFNTIQKNGTPATIYSLFKFLRSDNTLIQEKSAETIVHLFDRLKSQNEYTDSLKNLNISKSDLDFYRGNFEENIYLKLLGIASLNCNGYVREKAVNELARLKNIDGLKFILLRLSDWVLPVRNSALKAITSFLTQTYFDGLLKNLLVIDWLLTVKRIDLTEIHNTIIQFILSPELSDELFDKMKLPGASPLGILEQPQLF
jgi:hypothetical protein